MLELKKIDHRDVTAVVPLFLDDSQTRFWEDGRSHDEESAEEMLSSYFRIPSHHWILLWQTEVAGYGHVLFSDYLDAWIISYIVARKFQKQGVASTFVDEAKLFATQQGIERLFASIHPDNLASIRTIEKAGFELTRGPGHSENRLYQFSPTASH